MISENQSPVGIIQTNSGELHIDYPHKLKPGQIKELNKVVSTLSQYENTLKNLYKTGSLLFDAFLDTGSDINTEVGQMYLTIRALIMAIGPLYGDGAYDTNCGLRGKWNNEIGGYDQYK